MKEERFERVVEGWDIGDYISGNFTMFILLVSIALMFVPPANAIYNYIVGLMTPLLLYTIIKSYEYKKVYWRKIK